MRTLLMLAGFTVVCLWSPPARPCGGGFGDGLEILPSQQIVVVHRNGIETYIFNPSFCGEAAEFGLILPIPNALSASPELAAKELYDQLDDITAPIIEQRVMCRNRNGGSADGGSWGGSDAGAVQVIDKGQVGIFDWVLLQADSAAEFTNWLDTNGFPYDQSATEHFDFYVTKHWHFVAFRVTADENAPPAGTKLCGKLGPLSLSFPTNTPVVPARIAAAGATGADAFVWEIYTLADTQLRTMTDGVTSDLVFSGALSADDLAANPQVAQLGAAGDRLTKLRIQFWRGDLHSDINLTPEPYPLDYRSRVYTTTYIDCDDGLGVSCDGCSSGSPHNAPLPLVVLVLLALVLVRRRRR